MCDEVDSTADRMDSEVALSVKEMVRKASLIPTGVAGDCYFCGEYFVRVVEVTIERFGDDVVLSCGRCRDKRGLK